MWTLAVLLSHATLARAGISFEDAVRTARDQGPSAQRGEADLQIARARKGQSIARLLPQVSASDRFNRRVNNPERYTFSFDSDEDCDPAVNPLCLPIALGEDGQITLPENTLSNSLGLRGSLPVNVRSLTGVRQAGLSQELTRLRVDAQDERLVLDLVGQYAELQYGVGALMQYEARLALAEETLAVVQGRFTAGEATELDVEQATIDVDEASLAIAQIERALPAGLDRLRLLGSPVEGGLLVCPFGDPPDPATALDLTTATSIASAETSLQLDRLRRTQDQLDVLPTLTLVGGASWTANGQTLAELGESFLFDNWYVGATLSLSLFEGGARLFSRREAAAAVRKSELDLAQERETLALDDRDRVDALADVATEIDLAQRQLDLQSRQVEAARALYFDGGETTFDRYTQARQRLEQRQQQLLALKRQRQQLTAQRWVLAGHADALLDHLFAHERTPDTQAACRTIAP